MTAKLVTPTEAVEILRAKIDQKWAEAICADHGVGAPVTFSVPLRPSLSSGKAVEQIGYDRWHEWHTAWRTYETQEIRSTPGTEIIRKPVTIRSVTGNFPATLVAENLSAAAEIVSGTARKPLTIDIARARSIAASLHTAGATLTQTVLKAVYRLGDPDAVVLFEAVSWLREHPDVGSWTARQLPIPGMHSKWLENHGTLLRAVIGRDVRTEVRPRLAVVHLTYVDPDYTASGKRRHDAWTTGDTHDLAYSPRIVLIVENRDCRLWFPPAHDTIVVEGGGKAAASLLADITWIRTADHIIYWGDIDADGYTILDRLRTTMSTPTTDGLPAKTVHSILMDTTDLHHYAHHGVNHDKTSRPIKPTARRLTHLTQAEATAYDTITTAGPVPFRRIEQEAIPLPHAAARLKSAITPPFPG